MRPFISFIKEKYGDQLLIGAEVGVLKGNNARSFLGALRFENLHLVDLWGPYMIANKSGEGSSPANFECHYPFVVKRFGGRGDVEIHKMPSVEAAGRFPDRHFDFVYLDACHSYDAVSKDIEAWSPKIKASGVIGGHDYRSDLYPGLFRAVNEFVDSHGSAMANQSLDWWVDGVAGKGL